MSTLQRYLLYQLPGWALAGLALVSLLFSGWIETRVAAVGWLLWVIKDFALYPLLRSAYERSEGGPVDALIGASAVARERLAPEGYVRVRGELWRARVVSEDGGGDADSDPVSVEIGTELEVVAVEGARLLVCRVADRPGPG